MEAVWTRQMVIILSLVLATLQAALGRVPGNLAISGASVHTTDALRTVEECQNGECLACLDSVSAFLSDIDLVALEQIAAGLTDYTMCTKRESVPDDRAELSQLNHILQLLMDRGPIQIDHEPVSDIFEPIRLILETIGAGLSPFQLTDIDVKDFSPFYVRYAGDCDSLTAAQMSPVFHMEEDCYENGPGQGSKSCIKIKEEQLREKCRNSAGAGTNFAALRVETYESPFFPSIPLPHKDMAFSKWTVTVWATQAAPLVFSELYKVIVPNVEQLFREESFVSWPSIEPDGLSSNGLEPRAPSIPQTARKPEPQNSMLIDLVQVHGHHTEYRCVRYVAPLWDFSCVTFGLYNSTEDPTLMLKCFCDHEGTYTVISYPLGTEIVPYTTRMPTSTTPRTVPAESSTAAVGLPNVTVPPGVPPVLVDVIGNYTCNSTDWITVTPGIVLEVVKNLPTPVPFQNVVLVVDIIDKIVDTDCGLSSNITHTIDTLIGIYDVMLRWDTINGSLEIPSDPDEARRVEQELYAVLERIPSMLPVRKEPYEFYKSLISLNVLRRQPASSEEFVVESAFMKNYVIVDDFQSRTRVNSRFQFAPDIDGTGEVGTVADFRMNAAALKSDFESAKGSNGTFSIMLTSMERFRYAPYDHSQLYHSNSKARKVSPIMFLGQLSKPTTDQALVVSYRSQADALLKTPAGGRYRGIRNYECIYFDYNPSGETGVWSNKGCRVKEQHTTWENGTTVECECDHLTPFTLFFYLCDTLIDLEENEQPSTAEQFNALEPRIIATFSLSISIICIIVVLLHSAWKLYRKFLRMTPLNFTRLNMAVSLVTSNITFLVAEYIPDSDNQGACLATALFSHWFMFAAFAWMSVETYFLLRIIRGRLLNYSSSDNFDGVRWQVAVVAWGLPILFPFFGGLSHIDTVAESFGGRAYGTLTMWCWIDPQHLGFFFATFVVPICIIALTNISFFAYYLYKRKEAEIEAGQRRTVRQGTVSVVGTCFLLGATWLSAYVMLMMCCNDTAKKVAGVFFILLNGSQGVFVMWVYVTRLDGGFRYLVDDFRQAMGPLFRRKNSEETHETTAPKVPGKAERKGPQWLSRIKCPSSIRCPFPCKVKCPFNFNCPFKIKWPSSIKWPSKLRKKSNEAATESIEAPNVGIPLSGITAGDALQATASVDTTYSMTDSAEPDRRPGNPDGSPKKNPQIVPATVTRRTNRAAT